VVFVDTNVYFYAHENREPDKQNACREWLRGIARRRLGRANLQVANEFTHIVLRKLRLPAETVFRLADDILLWGDSPVTSETVSRAREIHQRYGYSWWDAILLASALELSCTHFLSEDLQDGQQLDSLTIVDPFAHSPAEFFKR
jgi:predicted nucleic acid-binding protein